MMDTRKNTKSYLAMLKQTIQQISENGKKTTDEQEKAQQHNSICSEKWTFILPGNDKELIDAIQFMLDRNIVREYLLTLDESKYPRPLDGTEKTFDDV